MTSEQLKAWRKANGYSQRSFAAALGMHWRTIQEYEADRLTVPKYIELACRALEREHD